MSGNNRIFFSQIQIKALKKAEEKLCLNRKDFAKKISDLSGIKLSTDKVNHWFAGTINSYDKRYKKAIERVIQEGEIGSGTLQAKTKERVTDGKFSLAIFGALSNVDDDQEMMKKKIQKSNEYALRIAEKFNKIYNELSDK